MSNLNVTGQLKEQGVRVFSANNPPVVALSSRFLDYNTGNLSGTGGWVSIGNPSLAAGEAITSVYAIGKSAGQHSNNAIWYFTTWRWNGSNVEIYFQRQANDGTMPGKVVLVVTKFAVQAPSATGSGTTLNVSGQLKEQGVRVYGPNNLPTLSVSSRAEELTVSAQSGTGKWIDTNLRLNQMPANTYVTGAYAIGMPSGQYGNNALWYMTNWRWNGNDFEVYIARGANDHSDQVKVVLTFLTISFS